MTKLFVLQVLQDLKHAIDKLARERDNFDTRLGRAKKTMIFKAAVSNGLIDEATAAKISSFVHELPRSESQLSIDCNDTSSPIKGIAHILLVYSIKQNKDD